MATTLSLLVVLAASAGPGLLAGGGAAPVLHAQQDTTQRSAVRLVSDAASIRAGEPFTVGLHITLEDGWRTPWRNAGDVGSGLIATWSLPGGFVADSFAYPIPERVPGPGVVSYGYHGEVVFLATITPPLEAEPARVVRLRLSVDFVICGHTCIPEHADLVLELPVDTAAPRVSDESALIRRYAERLPLEDAQWTTRIARTDSVFTLGVAPPADWEGSLGGAYFFPADPALLDHAAEQPVGRTAAGEYRIRLTRSAYLAHEPERIEGVLVIGDAGAVGAAERWGLALSAAVADGEAAWTAEATEPVAAPGQAAAEESGTAGRVTVFLTFVVALLGGGVLTRKIVGTPSTQRR